MELNMQLMVLYPNCKLLPEVGNACCFCPAFNLCAYCKSMLRSVKIKEDQVISNREDK